MKRGDIIFVRGKSLISKMINKVDNGEFSHVAVALSEDTVLEAQRFTESRIVKNYFTDYVVLDLDLDEEQIEKVIDSSLNLIGKDYDYRQIVSTFFNNVFKFARHNNRSDYICSELVIDLLCDIGFIDHNLHDEIHDYTTNELYKLLVSRATNITKISLEE